MNKKLTLLTFNTFGVPFRPNKMLRTLLRNSVRERYRQIAKNILEVNPDVLMFQEVIDYPHVLFLKSQLTMYPHMIYKPMLYGPRGGVIIFSKLPVESYIFEDFMVKGKLFNKSVTGLLTKRGILTIKLKDFPLYLINTHLTQNSDHDWSPTNRYISLQISQLSQLASHIRNLKKSGSHVIVAGDLNIPKSSALYASFMQDLPLEDKFKDDDFPTYHEIFLPEGAHVGRIDYMFSDLPASNTSYVFDRPVLDRRGRELYLSDHIGLLATIDLP